MGRVTTFTIIGAAFTAAIYQSFGGQLPVLTEEIRWARAFVIAEPMTGLASLHEHEFEHLLQRTPRICRQFCTDS